MHLLHRSSLFGGGGGNGNGNKKALRRVGSSPRAAPRVLMSRSESIKQRIGGGNGKKKGGGVKHGSKRAMLRAGLAAALQELRLAGRRKHRGVSATATWPAAQAGGAPSCADAERAAAGSDKKPTTSRGSVTGGTVQPLLLLVLALALACVVVLGKAPAVCCCTCAAWCCRGSSVDERRRLVGVLFCDQVARPQAGASAIRRRC